MHSRESNQRDFYRVDCRVVISHCVVGDRLPSGKRPDSYFADNEHFNLLRELRRMDQENSHLIHAIGEQDRNLGSYLSVMNRKIDTIARHLATLTPEMNQGSEQTVSLSEGGMSFLCDPAPAPGSVLALRLTLLPAYVGLILYASVIKVEAKQDSGAQTYVNFERLEDTDRQIIARHVMQIQMAQRKLQSSRV